VKGSGGPKPECMWSYLKPAGEILGEDPPGKHSKNRFKMAQFLRICTDPNGCKAYPGDWDLFPDAVERIQNPNEEALVCFHEFFSKGVQKNGE